jgi:hypothetical protein
MGLVTKKKIGGKYVVAVFGDTYCYTQWFERLGSSPGSVPTTGSLAIVFAVGLRALNAERPQERT